MERCRHPIWPQHVQQHQQLGQVTLVPAHWPEAPACSRGFLSYIIMQWHVSIRLIWLANAFAGLHADTSRGKLS